MKNIELPAPSAMSALGRAAEIASILANAIIRTQLGANKIENVRQREVGLAFSAHQSVHATPYPPRG